MAFKFEKLIVWQKAADLSEKVNELVKKFPKDELYILTSQVKRAADSISLNIAEGSTGQSNAEFNRFWDMPYGLMLKLWAACILLQEESISPKKNFKNFINIVKRY